MKSKNKKESIDQSLSDECCTNASTSASCCNGNTTSTLYCQTLNTTTKTKTKTIDVYRITKRGNEVLVGKKVITTTKTTYPKNSVTYPPYTITCGSSDTGAYPAGTTVSYTASASCTSNEFEKK